MSATRSTNAEAAWPSKSQSFTPDPPYSNNGNSTLFFTTLFAFLAPQYRIFGSGSVLTTFYFWYLLVLYGLLYFTKQGSAKYNVGFQLQSKFTTLM